MLIADGRSQPSQLRLASSGRTRKLHVRNRRMMPVHAALIADGRRRRVTRASVRDIRPDVSIGDRRDNACTARHCGHKRDQQQHRDHARASCIAIYVPVILMRSSSGSRCRISSGNRSCTRRAPSLAASSTVTGAGVATATPSQISAESPNPASARDFQPEGMPRAQVPDHAKRQQKHRRGNRGQRDQPYIDDAMDLLAAAAAFTAGKMALRSRRAFPAPGRKYRTASPPESCQRLDQCTADSFGGTNTAKPANSPATGESAPAPRSATPEARGCETTHPAWPAPFLPLSGLFPDDCSALKDAPAPQTLHYYHSRS